MLLGNEPVLEPQARLYQRLLAGDPDEATDHAEEFLKQGYLIDFYDKIGIPALLIGERDRQRGVMLDEQRVRFAESTQALVANLREIAEEEENEEQAAEKDDADNPSRPDKQQGDLPDGEGRSLICIGGRGEIDDAAAAMLAQVFEVQGAAASVAGHPMLEAARIRELALKDVDAAVVLYLNGQSSAHARHAVRRLKRLRRGLRVGILIPQIDAEAAAGSAIAWAEINADFIVSSIADAVVAGLQDTPPVPLKAAPRRLLRSRSGVRSEATPAPALGP
ncbi:hypothetical protein J2X65_004127 [Ancylobacter sp. 3268]|nr:hypothetical protein [Ancylobacter sp. 3268]